MRDRGPILVPVDGSELAEGALPYAVALAKALDEQLILLTVWEGNDSELAASFPDMAIDMDVKAREHFTSYLESVKARLSGVRVETMLREGDAPEEIERVANETGARSIVVATHGRSGIGRWLYGSTASHLLRHVSVPVLAIGPHALERKKSEVAFGRLMVPLDGTARAEEAIPVAAAIAKASGARLSLVRVVQWAVQMYPYTLPTTYVPQLDDELEKGAKAYLQKKETGLKGVGVDAFVVRGAVADGLLDVVERESIDLAVMTTHARSGLARVALGSVADRMVQGTAPVMLIRPDA